MMDKVLYEWLSLKRSEGVTITGPMLQEKGLDLAKKMGEEGACQCVLVSVRWQRGWRRVAWRSADLSYDKMRECRVVIVDIISLLFKYTATSGIQHVSGPVDAG